MAGAALFAVAVVIVIGAFFTLAAYNAVVALRQRIDKAWGNIEVALQQRYDLLPNLVEAVRDLMQFERDVLERVTALRSAYSRSEPIPRQAVTSERTSSAVRTLFATVERYPEIRSRESVLALQRQLERLEGMIAARRELYNDQVFRYNTRIAQLPTALLAWALDWRPRPFFDAEPEATERPAADLGLHRT